MQAARKVTMSGTHAVLLAIFGLGTTELIVIGLIIIVLFGARLPRAARGFGQSIKEFKKGVKEGSGSEDDALPADEAAAKRIARDSAEKTDSAARERDQTGRGY